MKTPPTAVLLTDFGLSDQYVASMKGAILSLCPHAIIVDLSHGVSPQNISEAAFLLWSSYSHFPDRTVFVCVVDPGVGTKRKILCLQTGRHIFLAPDNGLLKFVLHAERQTTCNSVSERRYFLPRVSQTFHGRDIFAPVAAHLLRGVRPRDLGPVLVPRYGAEEFVQVHRAPGQRYAGIVLHIDHFGNIITNFQCARMPKRASLIMGSKTIRHVYPEYADASAHVPFLVLGSSGLVEISIRNGHAAEALGAQLDQKLTLRIL